MIEAVSEADDISTEGNVGRYWLISFVDFTSGCLLNLETTVMIDFNKKNF